MYAIRMTQTIAWSKFLSFAFLLLCVIGVMLPSDGGHGVTHPKSLAFLATAGMLGLYMLYKQTFTQTQLRLLLFFLASVCFLLIWNVVSATQSDLYPSGRMDQTKLFIITLFVPLAAVYMIQEKVITAEKLFRVIIYANCIYCTGKILLMGLHVAGIINVWGILHRSGLRFMSMNILGEVGRIQTSVDIATAFLIYFVLLNKKLNLGFSKKFITFYIFVSCISNFLSFSRFLWFVYFAGIAFYCCTLSFTQIIRSLILFTAIMFGLIAMVGPGKVMSVVEKRLFSKDNYYSDKARVEQVEALSEECAQAPFLGNGIGGYAPSCVRDYQIPHSYEVQWMAFLMQFGLIGVTIICVPLGFLAWQMVKPPFTRVKFGLFLMFGLWIVAGFTNPFLISLTSGIIYALFCAALLKLDTQLTQLYIEEANS